MHRYFPPPILTMDQSSTARQTDAADAILEKAFKDGFTAGEGSGYAAGFKEAEQQTRAAVDAELTELRSSLEELTTCNGVSAAILELLAARSDDRKALERDMRAALRAAFELLFPSLIEHVMGQELVTLVGDSLAAHDQEHLTIRAAPETIDAITARGLPASGLTHLLFVPDHNRQAGAADITWSGGGMTFDPGHLLQHINEAISPISLRKGKNNV